ncbi:hypothetical protein KP509_03G017800 [Ceratopteris richardii]|uniref:BHLH domain-containing protein n=1 Tax=Ceratopteris richardii TaxID=49495 RepID=A0A8T2V9F9_CERRI|nr:hypothetical protein KP509_03G017800 [Ceratopteris richardii]
MEYERSSIDMHASLQEQTGWQWQASNVQADLHYSLVPMENVYENLPQTTTLPASLDTILPSRLKYEEVETIAMQQSQENCFTSLSDPMQSMCFPSVIAEYCETMRPPAFSQPLGPDQLQSLMTLQAVLKSQYDLSLCSDELLAFDPLPALMHESFSEAEPHLDVQLCQPDDIMEENMLAPGFCFGNLNLPDDSSSPVSVASSVLTDTESLDNPLNAATVSSACNVNGRMVASLKAMLPIPGCSRTVTASLPWSPNGAPHGVMYKEAGVDDDVEIFQPPAQRRKLHGITLEQVLQAEKHAHTNSLVIPHALGVPSVAAGDALLSELIDMAGLHDMRDEMKHVSLQNIINTPDAQLPASESVQSQSIAARKRRHKIKEKTERLGAIIPGATRLDTAGKFDLAIKYVLFLKAQMICLENEVSLTQQRASYPHHNLGGDDPESFRRALIHRLLSSPDVQHLLSKEGLCIVTQNLANRLNYGTDSLVNRSSCGL